MKTSSVTISNRDVTVAGDWAIEHGNYDWAMTPAAGGAEVREQGRFVAVYHRLPDGSWKLNRDIWNSSLPLPTR
jgi:ketosteroid isomerase-like protein